MMFRSLVLSCSLLGFLANGAVMAMEEGKPEKSAVTAKRKSNETSQEQCLFEEMLHVELRDLIIQRAVEGQCLENKSPVHLALVCKRWGEIVKDLMTVNRPAWKAWHGILTPEDEKTYQTFLNGKLVYRPKDGSDEGMIELKISDLKNPLGSSFDLSSCGKTGQYLSIATGYRQGKKDENASKVEVWFTPRFLADIKLTSMAENHHLRAIIKGGNWDAARAPIGIFWTYGGWNAKDQMGYCNYLTVESNDELSSENLLKKYQKCTCAAPTFTTGYALPAPHSDFHISFVN